MAQGRNTNRQKDISRLLMDKNRQRKERAGVPAEFNKANKKRKGGKHG